MAETKTETTNNKHPEAEPLLSLSTEIKEPATVKVDDAIYKVYNGDHIGRDQEAKLMGLFREHDRWQIRLARSKNTDNSEKCANRMRDYRVDIITTVTTVPRSIVEEFGMAKQAALLEICSKELGIGDNGRVTGGDEDWEDSEDAND